MMVKARGFGRGLNLGMDRDYFLRLAFIIFIQPPLS
jgi:hypothetical protein